MEYQAHETAVIDPGATIGKGSRVWHWTHISAGVVIGEACSFGQNVFVGNRVRIGNNVKVQNNVSIYTGVICEDDVFLGPSMVFPGGVMGSPNQMPEVSRGPRTSH